MYDTLGREDLKFWKGGHTQDFLKCIVSSWLAIVIYMHAYPCNYQYIAIAKNYVLKCCVMYHLAS